MKITSLLIRNTVGLSEERGSLFSMKLPRVLFVVGKHAAGIYCSWLGHHHHHQDASKRGFYSYRTSHLIIIIPMSEWNSDRSSYYFYCKVPDSVKDGFSSWFETIDGHWLRSLKVRAWLGHGTKYSPGVCEWWVTIHGARIGFSLSESASPQTMHFSHFQPNCSCDWILFVSEV